MPAPLTLTLASWLRLGMLFGRACTCWDQQCLLEPCRAPPQLPAPSCLHLACPSPLLPCCSWPLDAAVLTARSKVNGLAAWAEQQIKELQHVLSEGLEADERESAEWKHLHRVRRAAGLRCCWAGRAVCLGVAAALLAGVYSRREAVRRNQCDAMSGRHRWRPPSFVPACMCGCVLSK